MNFLKWFITTTQHLKIMLRIANKLGWDDGLTEGYENGHTRGYKEGFETGRLYERSPELFGMNYLTYLNEIAPPGGMTLIETDIPQMIREAFNE